MQRRAFRDADVPNDNAHLHVVVVAKHDENLATCRMSRYPAQQEASCTLPYGVCWRRSRGHKLEL